MWIKSHPGDILHAAMSHVTRILQQIESGEPSAAEQLLPLVYEELRKLAAARMTREATDHTLQATALVHEAYIRLVDQEQAQHWNSRGHFFAAAAEAMRRILVEKARRKQSIKHGGERTRVELDAGASMASPSDDLLAVNDALDSLAAADATAAELVKLRYFAGLSIPDAAEALKISPRTANNIWAYARAWLLEQMAAD